MELFLHITIVSSFGLIVGSFLTMCIYRIPRSRDDLDELIPEEVRVDEEEKVEKEESEEKHINSINDPPRSVCPKCGNQLFWYHNIPLFSWIFLLGKCGFCKAKIPIRYPLVEFLSLVAAVSTFLFFGFTPTTAFIYIFLAALIVLTFIDLDFYILPNVITYPGVLLGLVTGLINQYTGVFELPIVQSLLESIIGLAMAILLWAFAEGYFRLRGKDGLGLGDVKLIAAIGALFGLEAAITTTILGSFLGTFGGLFFIIFANKGWARPFPFGPYLAVACIAYLFQGKEIIELWSTMFM